MPDQQPEPRFAPRVYVFDLDGVLYRGAEPVEGAAEAIASLRARTPAPSIFFLTNNSLSPRAAYVEKLTRLGMPCTEEEIVTSSSATAAYLSTVLKAPSGSIILAVGGPGIADELNRVGMTVVRSTDEDIFSRKIDYVVAGLDKDFNYHTLYAAQQAILRGATFIATNRDGQYPIEGGQVIPGGGAVIAAIEACTEVVPAVIGKPEPLGLQTILQKANAASEEAVMIGDRLDTDILCGNRLGVPTVLVLTGVTDEEKARSAPPEMQPSRIVQNLRELLG